MSIVSRPDLFSPFCAGALKVKNRVVLDVNDDCLGRLDAACTEEKLARVGTLVVTMRPRKGCQQDHFCKRTPLSDRGVVPLRELVNAAHLKHVVVMLRLEVATNSTCNRCLIELGKEEALRKQFETASRCAIEAGFDGTELELQTGTSMEINRRSDGLSSGKAGTIEVARTGKLLDIARRASALWGDGGRVGVKIPMPVTEGDAGEKTSATNDRTRDLFSALEGLGLMYVRISDSLGDGQHRVHRERRRRLVRDLRARFGGAYMASATEGFEGLRLGTAGSPDLLAIPWPVIKEFDARR